MFNLATAYEQLDDFEKAAEAYMGYIGLCDTGVVPQTQQSTNAQHMAAKFVGQYFKLTGI
jgi:hypothetical protein